MAVLYWWSLLEECKCAGVPNCAQQQQQQCSTWYTQTTTAAAVSLSPPWITSLYNFCSPFSASANCFAPGVLLGAKTPVCLSVLVKHSVSVQSALKHNSLAFTFAGEKRQTQTCHFRTEMAVSNGVLDSRRLISAAANYSN